MGQSYMVATRHQIRALKTLPIYILILLGLSVSGCATFNAATGRNEMILVSTASELAMGDQIHRELSVKNKILINTPEAQRLDRIGKKVERVSDRQDFAYHFYLIDSPEVNAFTIPGGHIYFYTGLLNKLTSDDQVAAVLAHEIGHVAAKHTIKKFQASMGYGVVRNVALRILSIKAPGIESIASIGSDGLMKLAMSSYGRQDEHEADALGIKYLYLSGYDLNAMIQVFHVLEASDKSQVPLIFRTHPYPKDRIKSVMQDIEDVKSKY